jgi:hypothetical protein
MIVGAEKAGTTALFAYLRRVPGVYMPLIKELNFFDRDHHYLDGTDFASLHKWFLFAPRSALIGEATPTYLMNPSCFSRIYDYNPNIKVIAILRSPVRRAHSAWNYRRVRLRDKRDFMTAVRVEVESGGDLTVARENKYRYIGAGRYSEQLREARRVLPAENLMLLKYEDFNRDQVAHVRAAIRFIGGPDHVDIPRIRRVNVWRYDRPLSEAEFETVLDLYDDEISEVEALTGWDCSDWRSFEGKTVSRSSFKTSELAISPPVLLPAASQPR